MDTSKKSTRTHSRIVCATSTPRMRYRVIQQHPLKVFDGRQALLLGNFTADLFVERPDRR